MAQRTQGKAEKKSKANPELVRGALVRLKLDAGGTDAECEERLAKHYKEHTPDARLGVCDVCGHDSDVKTEPTCPFCGDGGTVEVSKTNKGEEKIVEKAPPKLQAIDGGKDKAPPAVKVATAKKPSASLAPPSPVSVVAGVLDEAIAEVNRLKLAGLWSYWELGRAILRIFEEKLHTQRRDAQGAPIYKNWSGFCERELGMKAPNSYKLMDVAKHYSADDVAQVGPAKLHMMVALPPEDQKRLIERAKTGLPRAQLAEEVKALSGGNREPRETGRTGFRGGAKAQTKALDKAKKAKPKTDDKGRVSVAFVLGRTRIALMAKPARRGAEEKPAKKIVDEPHATEVLENGVVVTYNVSQNNKGELVLVVDRKRV